MMQDQPQPYPSYPQQLPPPPAPKKRGIGKFFAIGCGGSIVLALLIVIIAASAAGTSTSAPTAAATSTTDTSSTVQPTQAPTKAQLVIAWRDKYGSIIQTLVSDLNAIGTDGKNQDVTGMNTDCTTLQTDVAKAQSYPAIPDAQTANDWSSGLTYLASAAQDCVNGTANYDASLLQRATNELNLASAKIQAATNDINALIGQ